MRNVVVRVVGGIGCCFGVTSCSSEGPVSPNDVSVQLVSGNNQSGVVNTELPNPLAVKATTNNGTPIAGLTVNFVVVSGGGTMYAAAASTDNDGSALDYWTLGTSTAEEQRVEVRAVLSNGQKQVFGDFMATPLPGPVSALNTTLDATPTRIPEETGTTITVTVNDAYSNPVNGATVVLSATGSGNTITQPSNTNASGVATGSFSSIFGEVKTVSATANGTAITQTATVTVDAGPPAQIAVNAGDNQTAPMGTAVAIRPSVIIRDKHGSPTPYVPVTLTPTAGSGSVNQAYNYGPKHAQTGPDGIATADGWFLGCGATNSLVVTVDNYSEVVGNPVTFTAFGSAHECWDSKAWIPTARQGLGVAVVNSVLYAVGGNTSRITTNRVAIVESYAPTTDSWVKKASMSAGRYDLAVGTVNGILYAVGGTGYLGSDTTVEAYDPTTDSWTTKTPMHTHRARLGVGTVNGILYAVGGCVSASCPVEAYDPNTDSWTTKAAMPTSRSSLGIGVVNGILYAVGGCTYASDCSHAAIVEAYDPITNTWTTKAPMPTGQAGLGVGVVNGILYAFGGATVEAYDPITDTWTTKASMPTARGGVGVGVINGALYTVSGVLGSVLVPYNEAYHP